tara:strand:+ start:364 stop:519 length:156 start_codon:yes stop_codon:yes gene_type:complete
MKRNKFFPEKLYCLQGENSKFSYFPLQFVMEIPRRPKSFSIEAENVEHGNV